MNLGCLGKCAQAAGVASYHGGSFACPTGGVPHLIVSNFPVLGLVGGQEVIQGLQPPVVIGLQPESVIDPGAYALGVASGAAPR